MRNILTKTCQIFIVRNTKRFYSKDVKRKQENSVKGDFIMTLTNVTNVEKLLKTIEECEGRVELVTEQGDRYNLKSKLSQYVSFVKILANSTIPNIEIITSNRSDAQKLMKFMING